jgi:ankyrin repeat protein
MKTPVRTPLPRLLEAEDYANVTNRLGQTPLFAAAGAGNTDSISVLKEAGADLNATDSKGNTPLHLAVDRNRVDAVKLLIELGANRNAVNKAGQKPVDLIGGTLKPQDWQTPEYLPVYDGGGNSMLVPVRASSVNRVTSPLCEILTEQ